MRVHLDFETASPVDLKVAGMMRYVTSPDTAVLLAAWAVDDGPVQQLSFEQAFDGLRALLERSDVEIHAWNAAFEWAVLQWVLRWDVPLERMRCTMAHALYRAFPAKLDSAAAVMIGAGKPKDATRLLSLWSTGRGRLREGDWERFCEYNRNDVELERGIHRFLAEQGFGDSLPDAEQSVWLMSEKINWHGVPVDLAAADAARTLHARLTEETLARLKALTGVENPNSVAQLARWLGVPSLDKKALPDLLAEATGARREVLDLRRQIALSAPKKYTVAIEQAHDGRLRNMLQYSGAGRTHRWSGRGLQPQNLRRGFKDSEAIEAAWRAIEAGEPLDRPFDTLADLVRSIIVPRRGAFLGVADYSSIEVVMLHWAAGDTSMLQDLRNGLDPYKRFANQHWAIPVDRVTKEQRTFSKPIVLGCGYGLGADTLVEYAKGMGVVMSAEQANEAVNTYRRENGPVRRLWYGLEDAMRSAIKSPDKTYRYGHVRFTKAGRATMMALPSGRSITYWDARIDEDDRLRYMGVDQYTGHWKDLSTWGGKLVENFVQSISRDVLVHGLKNAVANGLDVILHVHDEIVIDNGVDDNLATLCKGMSAPAWCADAPITAAVFSCPRYRKD